MADEFDLYFVQTLPISLQIRGRFDRTYSLEILSRNLLVNKNICHAIGCLLALADAYPHKSSSFLQLLKTKNGIKKPENPFFLTKYDNKWAPLFTS